MVMFINVVECIVMGLVVGRNCGKVSNNVSWCVIEKL